MRDRDPDGLQRIEVSVKGRVQGVGYRYFVLRSATRLGLTGWVANEADGSVDCVAEGSPFDLDRFEAGLREGPPGAVVQSVGAVRMPGTGRFARFEVRSGAHRGD